MTSEENVFTVVYTGEPDEVYEFVAEGQGRFFGRDDDVCDIVVWSAITSTELSRVAGRIWRMDGELWVRNLSTVHELHVAAADGPPDPPLPPRRDEDDPGPARSVPAPLATVTAPGGCELVIRQSPRSTLQLPEIRALATTVNVVPVPAPLRPVAAALCEPLLAGGQLPAAYAEVNNRAACGSLKRARNLVG
ncbi:MAG: hypothetical protein ACRCSN_18150, partial [Dermatophilaceae bacterium]